MMYRYHLSRRKLHRPSTGKRGKKARSNPWKILERLKGNSGTGPRIPIVKLFLLVLTIGGVTTAGVWGWNAAKSGMRQSRLFTLQKVRTVGWQRPERIDVLERLRASSGISLIDLDLVSLKRKLLAEKWIGQVNLRKEYPDTLSVRVIERRPVAVLAGRKNGAITDTTGTVLEEWPIGRNVPGPWSELPVIHGVEPNSLRRLDPDTLQRFSTALAILATAPSPSDPDLVLEASRWDDVRVQRHGYWLRFGDGFFDEKWKRFLSVENEIEHRHDRVREVDLRFPDQVVVR